MYLVYVSAKGEAVKTPPEIETIVTKHPDLFEEPTRVVDKEVVHAIEIIPGSKTPKGRMYRMAPTELDELRRQLKELTKKGWIRLSTSPFGSPTLFVPNKGGTLRMCIDYRGLNAITVKNAEPLPRIDDLLDRVQGYKYYTKIDLKSVYHQIAIRPEDQHKTAFQTMYGLYEFVVMPFGLCNAPRTFQHSMIRIFLDYLYKFVVVYLDDILIFSKTLEEHAQHVDKVLSLLRQHKYKINLEKCEFNRTRILYLGHEVYADGIRPEDVKVASIHYLGARISEFGLSEDVTRSLGEAYKEDPITMDIINKLQAKDKATIDEFVMVDGLLSLEKAGFKRLVVPSKEILRSLFLGECHDATGHFGYKKTSANLVQRFWWPNMLDDAKYVQACQVCQRDKPRTQAPLGLLKPLPIPAGPGQSISMDFMDTLVTSKNGKRHIFVIVDRFTKYARLIAMPETARTEHVVKLFMDNWQTVKHVKKSQEAMIASENKPRRQSTFQVGERVWVEASELGQEFGISRKLMPPYFGPWEVLDILGNDLDGPSYVICIPGHLRTYPVFHASKLAPFAETAQFPSRRSMLPPTMDGHVDIDNILDHRDTPVPKPPGRGRPPKPAREYIVHFRHHTDPKDDRWISREELVKTAPQIVADYEKKLKGKAPA
ncbi:hypothetical protein CBR_g52390 [Chara braunii]|uniref:Reverse transcriptase domain-containing protein n=1 Tax=Chara braunii TaxID=69332 RepID=A0A388MA93_CHABU|nr:hypothetical protein CBR_g52390 [Chara braunii]|eukprot:GBG91435.1 hypothetical protein CBR_g52390 [Chara braunii]